jgi:PilZ domain
MKQGAYERRREERVNRVRARHVTWSNGSGASRPRDGWICDVSRGGISILVSNTGRPRIGDHFELNHDGSRLICTVVRQHGVDPKVSVVGCRAGAIERAVTTLSGLTN